MSERSEETRSWIERTLREALAAVDLRVTDESERHRGHAGAAEGGGHFRVRIVSDRFAGLGRLERHRVIYAALGDDFRSRVHALAIRAQTPGEADGAPASTEATDDDA